MNLNDLKKIQKIDTGRLAESLVLFPDQIKSAWRQAEKIKLPASYSAVDKVVVFGMGGSNLGARVIASVFKDKLKIPLIIEAGYEIPGFVGKKTLCLLYSYSGNTEETLSVFREVFKRGAKILAVGASSPESSLEALADREKITGLFFAASANLSGQPRAGLGYAIAGLLALLAKAKILAAKKNEIFSLAEKLSAAGEKLDIGSKNNKAKDLAEKLHSHAVILLGGDFVEGNLHALRNQLNENSKNFASYLVLPDMNHYALEGLAFPSANKSHLVFLIFNSSLYDPRVARRLELTKEIIKKNKINFVEYFLSGKTKLEQAAELLQFGGWLTFYLGLLNGANPSLIPWVDWFKKQINIKS
jgi:glucose/mannose-6-phosphate isomerase